MKVYYSFLHGDLYMKTIGPCDCPCDDLVDVQAPKMSIMALSYIAQAIVVTIVGLNMGFRFVRTLHERERGEVGGRDCWFEHDFFLCSFLFWIGKKTSIFGSGSFFGQGRAVPVYLRHTSPAFFRIMGQIQVLPKQTKLRREK
jgi:hypothetical protein